MLVERVLVQFPAHTHPLTLVSDPDGVLADEELRSALIARGFQVIDELDPIALRHTVQRAGPFNTDRPLVIVTEGALNTLPYDLWQQGSHVTLSLAELFPGLAPGLVRRLSATQRRRLSEALDDDPQMDQLLDADATAAYILGVLFDIVPDRRLTAKTLINWLDVYHERGERLPDWLQERLLLRLRKLSTFSGWPVAAMLADHGALVAFRERQGLVAPRTTREHATVFEVDTLGVDESRTAHEPITELDVAMGEVKRLLTNQTGDWNNWQAIALRWALATVSRYSFNGKPAAALLQESFG